MPNQDILYVGVGGRLFLRSTNGGALNQLTNYTGGSPKDIAMDPDNWKRVYVTDGNVNATVPRGNDPAALTLDEAVGLLRARAEAGPTKTARKTTKKVAKKTAKKIAKKATKKTAKKTAKKASSTTASKTTKQATDESDSSLG